MSCAPEPIPRRALGRTGRSVFPLGFGCSTIASLATRHAPAEVRATLVAARDAGIDFYDTADVYGQGDSERLLASVFGRSEEVVIATKVGMTLSASQRLVRLFKPVLQPLLRRSRRGRAGTTAIRQSVQRHCFEPAWLRSRVEASLRRLGRDRLQLLQLHSPPPEVAARDDVRQMLEHLQQEGLIAHLGVSVADLADLAPFSSWQSMACFQLPLTPGDGGLDAAARTHLATLLNGGRGAIAREVFAGGARARDADDRAASLRAVLAEPAVSVALAGMGCREHLRQNLAALTRASQEGGIA